MKSTLLSGIMLYMLMADGEGGAQVVSAASKKDQASIVFKECLNMVNQSKVFKKHIKKRKTDLYFAPTFSIMEPLASDSNTLDGLNIHLCVIDEVHSLKDRNLYEVLKQGMSARKQPMMVMITTAGTVRGNIYDDMYSYASKVAEGTIEDERFLPVLYELDDRKEMYNPKLWQKANPAIGIIKKTEDLEEKVKRAKDNPNDLAGILCKDFNLPQTNNNTWLSFEDIDNQETFDIEDFRNCYAIGGVDLSSTTDLTCATLILMKPDSEKKYIHQMYWLPEELIEKRVQEDKIPYDKWKERGLLRTSEGGKINYSDVTAWFLEMYEMYDIHTIKIGYDSWNTKYWIREMLKYGFEMIEVRMGYKTLSHPLKELGADIVNKLINYNNNPVLKWNLTNINIKQDQNGNIVPVKGVSTRARIDGGVSLLIAYTILFQNLENFKVLI